MTSTEEYDEEEILIYADFGNQLTIDDLSEENVSVKIIGLDSNNPVAEIASNTFRGTYDYAMGTNVFFVKDPEPQSIDPLFEPICEQKYQVFGKTNKVINFQRIYIEKIATNDTTSVDSTTDTVAAQVPPEDSLKVNITYDEAIKQFPSINDEE